MAVTGSGDEGRFVRAPLGSARFVVGFEKRARDVGEAETTRCLWYRPDVTPAEILSELEKLAMRLGVHVRFDAFDARSSAKGGLCRLRGQPIIVLDAGLPVLDKIGVISEALARFDLEAIYLPAILRSRFDRERRRHPKRPVRAPLRPPVKAVRRGSSRD
jgi:hypothetical protein